MFGSNDAGQTSSKLSDIKYALLKHLIYALIINQLKNREHPQPANTATLRKWVFVFKIRTSSINQPLILLDLNMKQQHC